MDNLEIDKSNEFKTFGISIENFSVLYGFFLIIWGILISILSGSNSFTSFIPSILGAPILIFAYLSIKFTSKKKNINAYCCSFWLDHIFWWIRFF